jgi:transcriptional regulator with XRE-family HTH domain
MAMTQQDKEREAAWLDAAMKTRGWENRDVAAKTGLEANWISQWKIANRPIPDLALFKLARLFGDSPFEIRPALNEYRQFFAEGALLQGLSDTDRQSVLRMIDGLRAVTRGISTSSKEKVSKLTIVDKEGK